jgi:lipopolysaccharide biosynthesis glycosyltransferase
MYLISTACDDKYIEPLVVMLLSLKENFLLWEQVDIQIIYNSNLSTFSEYNKNIVNQIRSNIIFHDCSNKELYKYIINKKFDSRLCTYPGLEVFIDKGYDKVLHIDADTICLQDFSEIFDLDYDFFGIGDHTINGGFFCFTKKFIQENDIYNNFKTLITKPDDSIKCHQLIVNELFSSCSNRGSIDIIYNYQKILNQNNKVYRKDKDNIKIIHYNCHNKPWINTGLYYNLTCDSYKLWHKKKRQLIKKYKLKVRIIQHKKVKKMLFFKLFL